MRTRGLSQDLGDPTEGACPAAGAFVVALLPFGLVGLLLLAAGDPVGWVGLGLFAPLLGAAGFRACRTRAP